MHVSRSMLLSLCLLLSATALPAQDEGKLGINLRVNGATQLGVTWRVSPAVTLRPSLAFDWVKISSPLGGTAEVTTYGLDLDVLFRGATWDRVTSYYGVGGGTFWVNSDFINEGNIWAVRGLLGARVRIVPRVALFGEVGIQYQGGDEAFGKEFSTTTFPIGIVVFLK